MKIKIKTLELKISKMFANFMYKKVIRKHLKQAVNSTCTEWDNRMLDICDMIFPIKK